MRTFHFKNQRNCALLSQVCVCTQLIYGHLNGKIVYDNSRLKIACGAEKCHQLLLKSRTISLQCSNRKQRTDWILLVITRCFEFSRSFLSSWISSIRVLRIKDRHMYIMILEIWTKTAVAFLFHACCKKTDNASSESLPCLSQNNFTYIHWQYHIPHLEP